MISFPRTFSSQSKLPSSTTGTVTTLPKSFPPFPNLNPPQPSNAFPPQKQPSCLMPKAEYLFIPPTSPTAAQGAASGADFLPPPSVTVTFIVIYSRDLFPSTSSMRLSLLHNPVNYLPTSPVSTNFPPSYFPSTIEGWIEHSDICLGTVASKCYRFPYHCSSIFSKSPNTTPSYLPPLLLLSKPPKAVPSTPNLPGWSRGSIFPPAL